MPADLFYFISSLPTLRWSEKAPFSYAAFMEKCTENLGRDYAQKLAQLQLLPSDEPKSLIARQWLDFEAFVRNTVGEFRKAKLRRQNIVFTRHETSHLSPGDIKRLEEIMALHSPLERENALDLFRWKYLDDLAAAHFYDDSILEIYALKLLLLEKQASRQLARGQEAFKALTEAGLQKAQEVRREEQA